MKKSSTFANIEASRLSLRKVGGAVYTQALRNEVAKRSLEVDPSDETWPKVRSNKVTLVTDFLNER